MTDSRKTLTLHAEAGSHALQLYVENIGRITYGPEILDNSKGLFGSVRLGGEEVAGWRITPLEVRDADTDRSISVLWGPATFPASAAGISTVRPETASIGACRDGGWARCGSTAVTWAPSGTRRSSSRSGFRRSGNEREPDRRFRHQEQRSGCGDAFFGQTRVQIISTNNQYDRMKKILILCLAAVSVAGARAPKNTWAHTRLQGCVPPRRGARRGPAVENDPRREGHAARPGSALGRNDNANNMADPVNDIPAEIGSLIYYGSSPS